MVSDRPTATRFRASLRLAGIGFTAIAGLAIVVGAINSEALVSSAFDRAFAALDKPATKAASRTFDGIAGSEDFWLRAENANIVKTLAVGQKITLNANGLERLLTITGVSDAADAVTHIQTTADKARILLITCREGDARTGREVRLRLEAGQIAEVPAGATAAPRAL